jgi:hypothetical protein
MNEEDKSKEWEKFRKKESAYLRRRRAKQKIEDFEIIIQVSVLVVLLKTAFLWAYI